MSTAVLTRARDISTIALAYTRLEAVEDLSYPMSVVSEHVGKIFPIFLYYFIARLVPARSTHDIGGDYFTFAVIGFAVAVALQGALGGFGTRLERAQNQGTMETLLVEPVPWVFVPIAMNVWRMVTGAVSCTLILLLGLTLGAEYRLAGVLSFVGIVGLGMLACMAIGIVSASLLLLAKRAQPIILVYGMAASLLGGALFPVKLLPGWLEALSYLIPHRYVISAARTVFMSEPPRDAVGIAQGVISLLVFNAIVLPVGMLLFSRSLLYARKRGTLGGY